MDTLTKDEVAYIVCALEFQLEHDDGSNPPPLAAGESALSKLANLAGFPRGDRQVVLFNWNTEQGECIECGLPAAYTRGGNDDDRLCCVCAAQAAKDGESINWLYEETERDAIAKATGR